MILCNETLIQAVVVAKFILRIRARELRRDGQSVKGVARNLGVAPSTVSVWCRDIHLTPDQHRRLQEFTRSRSYIGRMKAAETHRARRLERMSTGYDWARRTLGRLSSRDLLLVGVSLYWAEGSRKGDTRVVFTNSDPAMIRLMLNFFRRCCGCSDDRMTYSILINEAHRARAQDVLSFWTRVTGAPRSAFRKTTFIRTKLRKVYENHYEHFGTLKIRIVKGAEIGHRLWGAVAVLSRRSLPDLLRARSSSVDRVAIRLVP